LKIINLTENSTVYTSNVFLVRGTWNALEDVNTLVDAGRDKTIIEKINETSTGVGKSKVDQVILTHSHYDHVGTLPLIREVYNPRVYAFSPYTGGVDHILKDGDQVKMGDRIFEVYHTPGHSNDSICLYCESEGVLFVGDTPVVIRSTDGYYNEDFVRFFERLCRKDVNEIYLGHGDPIISGCKSFLRDSLKNIREAQAARIEKGA